jgi:uncharacterized protein (DUF1778 family)
LDWPSLGRCLIENHRNKFFRQIAVHLRCVVHLSARLIDERILWNLAMTAAASVSVSRRAKPQGARLEARMSPELHMTVKRAAEIQGRTVTDFVVHTLQIAATQAIEEASLVRLSLSDQQLFAQALISPPEPNAALKRAVDRYNKLLG